MSLAGFNDDIKKCLDVLHAGGVILYPTDTIWGLGCDATNENAVKKVAEIKQRCDSKSFIILLDSVNRLPSYISDLPPIAYDLIELSVSPLTLILDGARNLASSVIAADGSVAVRIAGDDFCKSLIEKFRKPIVSTSANFSGMDYPKYFAEIDPELIKKVDYCVYYRRDDTTVKKPSGIIRIGKNSEVKIIRE